MIRALTYFFCISIIAAALYYFGSSVALAILALLFVFVVMIHYLKSHIVEIEEHDYSKNVLKNKAVKNTLTLKNTSNNKSLPVKDSIPADPSVIAAFHQALREKSTLKTPANTAIKLMQKTNAMPANSQKNIFKQANELVQKSQDKAIKNENLTVSISSAAKKMQNEKISGADKGLVVNKVKKDPAKDKDLVFAKTGKKAAAKTNFNEKKSTFDDPDFNIKNNDIKSIFDELIIDDDIQTLQNSGAESNIQEAGSKNNNKKNSLAMLDDNQVDNIDQHESDIIKPKTSDSKKSDKKNNNLTEELVSREDEVLAEAKSLSNKGAVKESNILITKFLADNNIPLKPDVRAELDYLVGVNFLKDGKFDEARTSLIDYFSNKISKEDKNFAVKLAEISTIFKSAGAEKFALPFLITSLSLKREEQNFDEMDNIYSDIIKAYGDLDEKDKMIEAYQNQLAIKRRLNNFEGQLDVLDKLGQLYYAQKNNAGYSFCYQQTIEIKKQMLNAN